MVWLRLIRFVDDSGEATFGDACIDTSDDLIPLWKRCELYAIQLAGHDPFALERTSNKVKVKRLLAVLNEGDVSVFKCIGLNYMRHSMISYSSFIVYGTLVDIYTYISPRKWSQASAVSNNVYETVDSDSGIPRRHSGTSGRARQKSRL